ncbi:MAG: hypothetical protein HYW62_02035 [Candidatus Levybacteria bacterium]|nr:hypothetical protein [Candidatus Levybacteria bacterium]
MIEFKIDEASNLFLASLPIFGHPFAPGGIVSSVGILNSPLFNYILFPLLLISLKPQVVVLFIAILNSLANGFFYLIIRRYYNNGLAIITTLLIAFSPWSILFSRKIWPPDLIFPFFVILFFGIHKLLVDKKTIFWIPTIASAIYIVQLEMASGFFVLLGGALLLLQKPKINMRYISFGIIIGVLPLIPYLIYSFQNNCQECSLLVQTLGKKLSAKHLEVFARPFQILSQGNLRSVIGSYTIVFADNFPFAYNLRILFYSEYLLLPIGAVLFWIKYKKFRFFLYATAGLPILYFLFGIEAQMHYLIIISPLLFLFLGSFFSTLIRSKNFLIKLIFISYFSFLILYSASYDVAFFKFIRQFGGNMDGDYGLPFYLSQEVKENEYSKYKNRHDYQQIIISSYIPLYIMHGTSPFARMIYPYEKTEKIIPSLEQKLKDKPQDPRVLHQLVSYYSITPPKESTVEYLREKTRKRKEYAKVYDEIYAFYLQNKLKEVRKSPRFRLLVEFPQHWDSEEIDDKVVIRSSDYYVEIEADIRNFDKSSSGENLEDATYKTTKAQILNVPTQKTECITLDKKWCGTFYKPIQFYTRTFLISYGYISKNDIGVMLKNYKDSELLFSLKVMDEIVESIKEL